MSLSLSILIAMSMATPAFASEEDTDVKSDDPDKSYSSYVGYTGSGVSKYWVTVPSKLTPDGSSNASGTVTARGTFDTEHILNVTADPTVTLENITYSGDSKTLNIDFDGISLKGNNTIEVSTFENIQVQSISKALFGVWSGIFKYNVNLVGAYNDYTINGSTYRLSYTATVHDLMSAYASDNGYTFYDDAETNGSTSIDVDTGYKAISSQLTDGVNTYYVYALANGEETVVWDEAPLDANSTYVIRKYAIGSGYYIAEEGTVADWMSGNPEYGFGEYAIFVSTDSKYYSWEGIANYFNNNGSGTYTYVVDGDQVLRKDNSGNTWVLIHAFNKSTISASSEINSYVTWKSC
jgi:hypothetical protein